MFFFFSFLKYIYKNIQLELLAVNVTVKESYFSLVEVLCDHVYFFSSCLERFVVCYGR